MLGKGEWRWFFYVMGKIEGPVVLSFIGFGKLALMLISMLNTKNVIDNLFMWCSLRYHIIKD